MISGLPTPPVEDKPAPHAGSRRTTSTKKSSATSQRATKRTSASLSHEHGAVVIDGRHKRVWKACERCRMKKTKVHPCFLTFPSSDSTSADDISAMASHRVRDARTMDWSAQPGAGKRQNSSNYQEGESIRQLHHVIISLRLSATDPMMYQSQLQIQD